MKEDLTNKEIEIKDIADGMSFEIDTADLWANIEPNLPPIDDRKNRPIWWMAAGAFLMFTLLGGTYSYFSEGKITADDKIEFAITKQTVATSTIGIDQNLTLPQESKPDKSSNVTQYKNSISNKDTDTPLANYDDGHSHDKVDKSDIIKTKNVANDIAVFRQPVTNDNISMRAVFEKETDLMEINTNSPIQVIQKVAPTVEKRSQLQGISSLNMIPLNKMEHFTILSIPLPIIEPLKSDKWQAFWQLSSGINTSDNRISFIDEEVTFDPQFNREQNLIGLSNSIHYGQENSNGWRILGGLSHVRSTIRYSNFEELVFRTEETGVESKTIDQFGNEFETLGQITVTSITQNDIVWHRNHDYVNLEIGFGKRHTLLEGLSFVTDVSAGYNIWSSHDGYYFEKENPTITKFTNSESHPYQNKGIDLVGKLGIEYDLGNVSIGLSSNYNHGLGNATKSNNYYQIKNSHYGVQLGVVYRP